MLITENRLRKIIEEEYKLMMKEAGYKKSKTPDYLKKLAAQDDEDGRNNPDDGESGAEGRHAIKAKQPPKSGTRVRKSDDTET